MASDAKELWLISRITSISSRLDQGLRILFFAALAAKNKVKFSDLSDAKELWPAAQPQMAYHDMSHHENLDQQCTILSGRAKSSIPSELFLSALLSTRNENQI